MFESVERVGFLSRIELEGESCRRERVAPFVSYDTMPGEGRNDIGDTRLLVESDDGLMSEV